MVYQPGWTRTSNATSADGTRRVRGSRPKGPSQDLRLEVWLDHLHHDQLEILTGSPDFDRTFELRGRDADFAHALIDPSMAEALLRDCQGFAIEMAGDAFVVYGPFVEPSEL